MIAQPPQVPTQRHLRRCAPPRTLLEELEQLANHGRERPVRVNGPVLLLVATFCVLGWVGGFALAVWALQRAGWWPL